MVREKNKIKMCRIKFERVKNKLTLPALTLKYLLIIILGIIIIITCACFLPLTLFNKLQQFGLLNSILKHKQNVSTLAGLYINACCTYTMKMHKTLQYVMLYNHTHTHTP